MVQAPEMENEEKQLTVQQIVKMWEEKAKPQSSSLDRGLCESPRKPPGVRGGSQTAIPSQGVELTLTSGEGECERRVCDMDGEPQCHVIEPTGDVCLTRFRAPPQPLSMETLQGVRDGLERRGELGEELGSCLNLALERFSREPQCVQENARLLIRCDGGELEFIAGQGQCEISVSCSTGEPQYHITEKTWDVFVDWMNSHQEPLSIENLKSVQNTLESWGAPGKELSGCFGEAISQFSQEPPCVQGNARMRIRWDRWSLEFLSGEGECEISVCCRDGRPQYDIGELPVHMYLDRLCTRPEPLSTDTLWRVWSKLGSCKEDRDNLRACFHRAWERFSREPQYVQENARLLIQCGKRQLRFTSGKGECEITVRYGARGPQYRVVKIPVPVYLAQLRARQLSLSADTLRSVLSELWPCDGDTDALRACFLCAWQGFRREPRCVQENARLLIRWDGEELEFVSGQGQCEISVLLADGRPQYHITELGGDRPVTWSHSSPEPLSVADLARVRDRLGHWGALGEELSGCFGETISQFSREPRCVQENARLLIRWDGQELKFVSGRGQCEISVLHANGRPQYHITELGGNGPVTWSHASPEPLSIADLARVRDRLGRWGALGEELSGCFGEAISQFSREPLYVQENARMGIWWGAGKLQFLSGKGQYTFSVSYQEGNPRYSLHVEDLPGHLYVTRLRSRKDPLTADSLFKFHTELGLCQGDTAAPKVCLRRAWVEFRREPRCVQENARLLIRWGRGELEFISGQGQCEISVLLADGEPQYHITELGGDRPVTWSHASPEPLSVADLARVRDRLGHWGVLGEDLSGCFGEAISQFSQEPPCVQESTRMGIYWGGGSLEFLSGEGQCEIFVHYRDGRPQYNIGELPVHMYMARLRACPEPLSADTLQRVRDKLMSCSGDRYDLRACFQCAWEGFCQEPRCVQENARLLIRWDGGSLEFLSGEGECEVSVCCRDGTPQYEVGELPVHMYLARLDTHREPLSADTLRSACDKLGSCKGERENLRACFQCAWEGFCREPQYVQENARLLIRWDRGKLKFTSGKGKCEISVRCVDGKPQYHVRKIPVHVYLAQLRTNRQSLSADTLQRVLSELGSCRGDTGALRACFDRAWQGFCREPRCVQENARLLIRWDGQELEFVSGRGQCEISVLLADGRPQYHIAELGGDKVVTWSHTSPEPLSVADLARVRDRLGCWGALGKELSGCFGEAIFQFSREPPCVQENGRMGIYWGGGSLEFLSGEGQCEIFVRYGDGKPQYDIGELPVHMYMARLHTHQEPLSTDTLRRIWSKLESCNRDRDLRACFHFAWDRFSREPPWVQGNATMLIHWDGGSLQFLSGEGECEISVSYRDGKAQYRVVVKVTSDTPTLNS